MWSDLFDEGRRAGSNVTNQAQDSRLARRKEKVSLAVNNLDDVHSPCALLFAVSEHERLKMWKQTHVQLGWYLHTATLKPSDDSPFRHLQRAARGQPLLPFVGTLALRCHEHKQNFLWVSSWSYFPRWLRFRLAGLFDCSGSWTCPCGVVQWRSIMFLPSAKCKIGHLNVPFKAMQHLDSSMVHSQNFKFKATWKTEDLNKVWANLMPAANQFHKKH